MVDFMSSLEGNPSEKMLLGLMRNPSRGIFRAALARLARVPKPTSAGRRGRPQLETGSNCHAV